MLVGGPLVASASETNSAVVTAYSSTTQQPGGYTHAQKPPVRSQFVGPYELHHGLLPNGLMPNLQPTVKSRLSRLRRIRRNGIPTLA
jgi:hypothetical protein